MPEQQEPTVVQLARVIMQGIPAILAQASGLAVIIHLLVQARQGH